MYFFGGHPVVLIVLRYSPGNLSIFNRGVGGGGDINRLIWVKEGKVVEGGVFRPPQSE